MDKVAQFSKWLREGIESSFAVGPMTAAQRANYAQRYALDKAATKQPGVLYARPSARP